MYYAGKEQWGQILTQNQVNSLSVYTEEWPPEAKYREMQEEGIELLTISDRDYPERLRVIPDAPYGLFVRGKLPAEDIPAVAVIGARECSEYGKYVARELGNALGHHGVVVVSGMAKGIDGISQEAALEGGGISLGPKNFPPRNRIVSGLADAVVVVEARVRSGTLITVDMALEQGREVYVVPGRVTDRLSDGCNGLIKQGAGVVLSPESFYEELLQLRENKKEDRIRLKRRRRLAEEVSGDRENTPLAKRVQGLSEDLRAVYQALDFSPRTAGEIGQTLSEQYDDRAIISCLMRLCMEELAVQVSPGHFCRRGD